MTYQVLKSKIAAVVEFDKAVATHRAEMAMWQDHMKLVEAGKAQKYPAPIGHPEVVAAAVASDYTIVDDGPTADEILRRKKDELIAVVTKLERQAHEAIVPLGKRRAMEFRQADIANADAAQRVAIVKKESGMTADAIEAAVIKARPPADTLFLAYQAARAKKYDAIARHGARLHSDIEDLYGTTIDAWKPAPFPT